MKENVRMKQNNTSQNIRKKYKSSSSYESLGRNMGALMEPFGLLMRSLLGPYDHVWTTYRPPRATFGPSCAPICSLNGSLRAQYAPKWTLMDPMDPLWPLMEVYGPVWAPYCAKVGQMECTQPGTRFINISG